MTYNLNYFFNDRIYLFESNIITLANYNLVSASKHFLPLIWILVTWLIQWKKLNET